MANYAITDLKDSDAICETENGLEIVQKKRFSWIKGSENPEDDTQASDKTTTAIFEFIYDQTSGLGLEIGTPHPGYSYCKLLEIRVDPVDYSSGANVTLIYRERQYERLANDNGEVWEFDFGSRSQHVSQTRTPEMHFHDDEDYESQQIGCDGESVKGVDIEVPVQNIRVTKNWGKLTWTELVDKINAISDLHGKTNSADWLGFYANDLRFNGCQIAKQGDLTWQFVYSFAKSKSFTYSAEGGGTVLRGFQTVVNEEPELPGELYYRTLADIDVGTKTRICMGGHDYFWARNGSKVIGELGELQGGALGLHIAQVYDGGDFTALELLGEPEEA